MVWHASTSTHCWAEEWPQTVENEECARPSQALQEDPLWISTKILSGQSMAVDDVMGWNKTFDESKILARIAWLILLAFILEGLLYEIIRRTVIRFIRLVGHGQQIQIVFITCKHAFTLTHTHTHTQLICRLVVWRVVRRTTTPVGCQGNRGGIRWWMNSWPVRNRDATIRTSTYSYRASSAVEQRGSKISNTKGNTNLSWV